MKIKIQRLHIRDFGILRDQTLEPLHPGLVVIGGLNRAGKSTLMHVLRCLGYGFPRGGNLPPATVEYEVEADVSCGGALYSLRLRGYAAPTLTRISPAGSDIEGVAQLYSPDSFTYGQLFTITLEELQGVANLPAGERRRLQSVLLGAGLKEVAMLPRLKKELSSRADAIGGTRGNPSVAQFRKFHGGILEGQAIKNRGLSHVRKYGEQRARLNVLKMELKNAREELALARQRVRRLDLVKNHFENYLALERLGRELKYGENKRWRSVPGPDQLERVTELLARCAAAAGDIKEREIGLGFNVEGDTGAELSAALAARSHELAGLAAGVSGVKERLRQVEDDEQQYNQLRRGLADRIRAVNVNWPADDLRSISALRTDAIERHRLEELVEKHYLLQAEQKEQHTQLSRLRVEQQEDEADLQALEKPRLGLRAYIMLSLITAAVCALAGLFFNPWAVSLLGLAALLSMTAYYFTGSGRGEMRERRRDRLVERAAEIAVLEKSLAEMAAGQAECWAELEQSRSLLSLDEQVPFSRLPGYLEQAKVLQERILELARLEAELSSAKEGLEQSLRRYSEFLSRLAKRAGLPERAGKDIITLAGGRREQWAQVFLRLEQWQEKLAQVEKIEVLRRRLEADRAEIQKIMDDFGYSAPGLDLAEEGAAFVKAGRAAIEVAELERKLAELQREVQGSLASDAVREAFGLEEGDGGLDIFRSHCAPYAAVEEAEQAHRSAVRDRDEQEAGVEELKDHKLALVAELERLSSQRDVEAGQAKIYHNRAELRRLAESYALYRAAAFLLQETEQNLLSGMKDSIMAGAGKMFKRITGGAYAGIEPGQDLLEQDFHAVLPDNADPQTMAMLSRGTREQLYLAVRLSRILEVQPALPIIIDDSLANFDAPHLDQSLRILHQLAETHQIFVLTCHGRLVEKVAGLGGQSQFWRLEQGKFAQSEHEELIKHLG